MLRTFRPRADERVYRVTCRCVWLTARAICVDFPTKPGAPNTWIPNEAVHPASTLERRADGVRGELLIRAWFAKKLGLMT